MRSNVKMDVAFFLTIPFVPSLNVHAARLFIEEEIGKRVVGIGSDITASHHFNYRQLCVSLIISSLNKDTVWNVMRELWLLNWGDYMANKDALIRQTWESLGNRCTQSLYIGQTTLHNGKNGFPFDGMHVERFARRNTVQDVVSAARFVPLEVNTGIRQIDIYFKTIFHSVMMHNTGDYIDAINTICGILPEIFKIISVVRERIAWAIQDNKDSIVVDPRMFESLWGRLRINRRLESKMFEQLLSFS